MKRIRAYTLVELMITVAMIGILSGVLGTQSRNARLGGLAELQRERALLYLEYEADLVSRGRAEDPAVVARLVASLPDVRMDHDGANGVVTLTVTWREPSGRIATRSLAVFKKAGTP